MLKYQRVGELFTLGVFFVRFRTFSGVALSRLGTTGVAEATVYRRDVMGKYQPGFD